MDIRLLPAVSRRITLKQAFEALNKEFSSDQELRKKLLFSVVSLGAEVDEIIIPAKKITIFSIATLLYGILKCNFCKYPLVKGIEEIKFNTSMPEKLCRPLEGIVIDNYFDASGNPINESVELDFISTTGNSSVLQADIMVEIANTMVICGFTSFAELNEDAEQIDQIYQSKLNIKAEEYFLILFALWSSAASGDIYIDSETLLKDVENREKLNKALKIILEDLAFTVGKDPDQVYPNDYSGYSKVISFFTRYPLVKISENIYLISCSTFLKMQLLKFINKSLAFARELEGVYKTKFSNFLGKQRLEPFFSALCSPWIADKDHSEEFAFSSRNQDRSPDFIVFENNSEEDVAHLFQIKLKMPTEKMMHSNSYEKIEEDLDKFSELIFKSINALFGMYLCEKQGSLNVNNEEISKKILNARYICFWGIIPHSPDIFHLKYIRDRTKKIIEKKLSTEAREWFFENYGGLDGDRVKWMIIRLIDFETFLSSGRVSLYKTIKKYFRYNLIDTVILFHAIQRIPRTFRDFLITDANKKIDPMKSLKNIFDEYKEKLFKKIQFHKN